MWRHFDSTGKGQKGRACEEEATCPNAACPSDTCANGDRQKSVALKFEGFLIRLAFGNSHPWDAKSIKSCAYSPVEV